MVRTEDLLTSLREFHLEEDERTPEETRTETIIVKGIAVERFANEFWTSKQRKGSSVHEVSYRACFKPQLPRFFIERLSGRQDVVLDPFSGRGTTIIEAALLGRRVISNDVNPLSSILSRPRLDPPTVGEVRERTSSIDLDQAAEAESPDLSMFYHKRTLGELLSLRDHLSARREGSKEDHVDRWIRMVATNRLTGHSRGFFSVYTLPPNQAVTPERQILINRRTGRTPEYRNVKELMIGKTRSLLRNLTAEDICNLKEASRSARFLECPADRMDAIGDGMVDLTVTSPPFLNIVQYSTDNWLRCWFNGLDAGEIERRMTLPSSLVEWERYMSSVFGELYRVTRKGGWVAFEVGEVRNGGINLDEAVVPLGSDQGFECVGILVNDQVFTKTSNIWGVSNNRRGTNTNRIVIFKK
ncbi:MAG: site-specific DNA-methyltransferase [Candidatus Thermoplasmatota archaeon]|nr:site-specific DNA-methyltransferase [Candidatus Thermoplasmatota archaeon]